MRMQVAGDADGDDEHEGRRSIDAQPLVARGVGQGDEGEDTDRGQEDQDAGAVEGVAADGRQAAIATDRVPGQEAGDERDDGADAGDDAAATDRPSVHAPP